jgi:DNA polymerase
MPERAKVSAQDYLPPKHDLKTLAHAAQACRGCDLYKHATQAVFGEGPPSAPMMLVGEQPGDQEDRAGHPFVGPAGRVLDEALKEAGIDRGDVYVTNAVKHFKSIERGKRRLHAKPSAREARACRPWLEVEIEVVHPAIIVCLGATAAQSLLGSTFRLTQHLGEVLSSDWAPGMMATYHPSAILRAPDETARKTMRRQFVDDLRVAAETIGHMAK